MQHNKCYIGVSRGGSIISTPVAYVTAPAAYLFTARLDEIPSHAFIGFESDAHDEYFEALESTKGFNGPKPIFKLQRYLKRNPAAWAKKYYLDLSQPEIMQLYADCVGYTKIWKYAHVQLARQYLYIRLKIPFKSSPNSVTCSESITRVISPYNYNICNLLNIRQPDYVTPFNVMQACEMLALRSIFISPQTA